MEPTSKTVLLVDDDKFFRQVFTDFLHAMGFSVTTASDGRSAKERLLAEPLALVCLDLTLPDDVSGYDICEFIRGTPQLAELPILMVSARDRIEDRANAEDAGANAYLVKPGSLKAVADFERVFTQHVRQLLGPAGH